MDLFLLADVKVLIKNCVVGWNGNSFLLSVVIIYAFGFKFELVIPNSGN